MESSILFSLFVTLLFFTSSTTSTSNPCDVSFLKSDPSDLSVIHVYGRCSPFFIAPKTSSGWIDTVMNMASKDPQRVTYLSSLVATKGPKPISLPIASGQSFNIGNYIVKAKIGTPPQVMFMVLDTSNNAAWVPCSGCTGCTSTTLFTPNASSTYGSVDCTLPECSQVRGQSCPSNEIGVTAQCSFNQSYGGDSSFSAALSRDSLALASDIIPNYAFGCVNAVSGKSVPPQGLLGLGRGPMSLMSQSGSLYSGVFSYCLPSFKSYYFSGSLKLGPVGQPKSIRTTPLLQNPRRPSLYYVNLTGISVGKVLVPIAPELLAFDQSSGAGTIIDSGTVITRFVPSVYEAVRNEFRKQVGASAFSSLGAFDTCFMAINGDVGPTITFHFTGLDLALPQENSLIHSSSGSLACLAMAAAPNNVNSVLNVIANLQQQNLRILFDTANSLVGIARENCN
ncbi:aspartyl protease AED3 [Impatiens glandulifera]|uniref:aspartyl protease AED3 n=1 Tax=Impatiens glandulifera TaxID=253017 RepID=UPI001FB121A6|nr:aspartyl protease AED3 [Impatiens glandulifera]